jgi:DASH complex subunit ASK1
LTLDFEESTNIEDSLVTGTEGTTSALQDGEDQTMMTEEDLTAQADDSRHHNSTASHEPDVTEILRSDDELAEDSTPRPHMPTSQFAKYESPYQALRREQKNDPAYKQDQVMRDDDDDRFEDTSMLFQQHTARVTTQTSLGLGGLDHQYDDSDNDDTVMLDNRKVGINNQNQGRLLHQVLDKSRAILATPGRAPLTVQSPAGAKWKVTMTNKGKEPAWLDNDPESSPDLTIPKLTALSPVRNAPRTPGRSVQTPGMGGRKKIKEEITWESDSDDDVLGMSPPKTINFSLQATKLIQTPGTFSVSFLRSFARLG